VLGLKGKIISGLILGILVLNVIINFNIVNMASNSDKESNEPYFLSNFRSGNYTWGQILPISEPIFGQDKNKGSSIKPSIAVEDENIYVVWQDSSNLSNSGTDFDVFYRFYDGNTWSDIQVISEPIIGQNLNTAETGQETGFLSIAVENGNIYVVWSDSNETNGSGKDNDIFFRCNLTGTGWEDIQVISEPVRGKNFNTGGSGNPDIAVENGNLYVIWGDNSNTDGAGTDNDIFFRCNLTGTRWEDIQVISEPVKGKNFNIGNWFDSNNIVVENGKIYTVWTDDNNTNNCGGGINDLEIFYRCNLTGTRWEPVQVISEPVFGQDQNIKESQYPDIAVENGKCYVVWRDGSGLFGDGVDCDIYYRPSFNGKSWEPIQVISEPVSGKDYNTGKSLTMFDSIEVENGNIFVCWQDRNDTNNAGQNMDIFFRCNISNSSWSPTKVISEPIEGRDLSYNYSNFPTLAVERDRCHVAWHSWDDLSGCNGFEIFYRWIKIPTNPLFLSLPKVTPKIGNTSTEFNFTIKYFHLNNSPPTGVNIYIDGDEHQMIEVDTSDTNYTNGKDYFFKMKNLDIGNHSFRCWASNGTNTTITKSLNYPKVLNTPPEIVTQDNITAIEDTYYETTYDYFDIDTENIGQTCIWDFNTNAKWQHFMAHHQTMMLVFI
jgi:hypothetical protein